MKYISTFDIQIAITEPVANPHIRVDSLLFLVFKTILSLWQTTDPDVRLGFGS